MLSLVLGTILTCKSPWIALDTFGSIKVKDQKVKIVDVPWDNNDYYGIEFTLKIHTIHGILPDQLEKDLRKVYNKEYYRPVNKKWFKENCK